MRCGCCSALLIRLFGLGLARSLGGGGEGREEQGWRLGGDGGGGSGGGGDSDGGGWEVGGVGCTYVTHG